ncbi:early activation antigen CD69 [Festucalex cinctus]
MEMQDVAAKKKQCEKEKAAKEPMLEVKGQGNPYTLAGGPSSAEEAEPDDYTGLKKPSEDIYSNISEPAKQPVKEGQSARRPYRVACLILTVLCFVLLLVIVVLLVKMKAGSPACPVNPVSSVPSACNVEQCRPFTPQQRNQCYCCHQCPPGWVRLDQSCFFLSTFTLSWDESQKNCSVGGGFLAVVNSQRVQTFLTLNGNRMKYWIGLRSSGAKWTWVDNTTLQQSYWGARQTSGDCGILSSNDHAENNWMKSPCSSYTYYICQVRL